MKNVESGSLPFLGNRHSFRKVVSRKRKREDILPPNPASASLLSIPETYRHYQPSEDNPDSREKFLLADNESENRIIIFGRESWINHREAEEWYCGYTFSISPRIFQQIFVILVKRLGVVYPVVYALLTNKRYEIYAEMFRMISNLGSFNPVNLHCDYEIAIHNAIKNVFPDTNIRGCFFHLCNNLQKFISHNGFKKKYEDSSNFVVAVKSIVALAFVPPPDIEVYIEALESQLNSDEMTVFTWFEDNYIGRANRRGERRSPIFPVEVWNVFSRVINDQDRTNNRAEAAHRKLQTELGVKHPTVWKLVNDLRTIQKSRDLIYERSVCGLPAQPNKLKKYREADGRILSIVQNKGDRTPLEYLRAIALNYQIIL